MAAGKMSPFVKWAGGKTQLLDRLEEHIPKGFHTYYEPFIGGGAFLLDLQPQRAVINDVNEQLLNVYIQLRADPEAVIALISQYDAPPCDTAYYTSMRDSYNRKIAAHELDPECAALMIWLNKHCFNGLYRVNSKGLFNVPYNNKTGGSSMEEDSLRAIGRYFQASQIDIRQGDFETACLDVKAGDFVYFDSPYVPINATAYFTDYTKDGFSLSDHKRLAALFRRLDAAGVYVMLSNHSVPLVHELYGGFHIQELDVRRSINCDPSKRVGKEVLVTNYKN